jgi:hypothetical protein
LALLDLGTAPPPRVIADHPLAGDLYGRPTVVELVSAVRAFMAELTAPDDAESKYFRRVAANVLGVAERECALGDAARKDHRRALTAIGFNSEGELALALRAGAVSTNDEAVLVAIRGAVASRLAVANPRYR